MEKASQKSVGLQSEEFGEFFTVSRDLELTLGKGVLVPNHQKLANACSKVTLRTQLTSGSISLVFFQEKKTNYKCETDFTTGPKLHIKNQASTQEYLQCKQQIKDIRAYKVQTYEVDVLVLGLEELATLEYQVIYVRLLVLKEIKYTHGCRKLSWEMCMEGLPLNRTGF
ncbi:hypothetical protein STEG23_015779 [Scotinomys teguina]